MKTPSHVIKFAVLLSCLIFSNAAFGDVKIKSRQTSSGQTFENTTYIKGKRQRIEQNTGGMEMVNITQCDLRRDLRIMPQSQTYLIEFYEQGANNTTRTAAAQSPTATNQTAAGQKGGVVTTVYTTKDTGERKQMFGYTARHILTKMETQSSPDACTQQKSKLETDGWYIDAAFALDCENDRYKNYRPASSKPGCQDRYEMKETGAAKRGYPVWEKMTIYDESGKEISSFTNEVVELSKAVLDATLFDVPAGYREVKSSSELYASAASSMKSNGGDMNGADDEGATKGSATNSSATNRSVANMAGKSANVSTEVGAKKAGVIRLGLATVKTGTVGEGMNATELAAAIQNSLAEYLKAPNIELVKLEARLPSQVDLEAKQKECDFVIYANAAHKKGGGGGGFGKMFGSVIAPAVAQTGIGHTGSVAGNIAGQIATTTIVSAGAVAANVKSKDELLLDVKVQSPGGATPAAAKQFKAKAKSDGDDIITLLVEQAAQLIVDAAAKK